MARVTKKSLIENIEWLEAIEQESTYAAPELVVTLAMPLSKMYAILDQLKMLKDNVYLPEEDEEKAS